MKSERLSVDALAAGMVLADDLEVGGQRLLSRDTVLSEKVIALLRQRGVNAVTVQTPEPTEDAATREVRRREMCEMIDHRFRHARGNALMEALRAAALAVRMKEAGCA